MKKLLLAGAAAALCVSSIIAAAPAKAAPPEVFNWSGLYIGVNGGVFSGNVDGHFPGAPGSFDPPGISGSTAGIHGGVQGQWGNLVGGAEIGFNAALSDRFGVAAPVTTPPCSFAVTACEGRVESLFTAGGRLGWAWSNLLFYGSGGFARGVVEVRGVQASGFVQDHATLPRHGWYAGGGIEYALMKNLTLGIDWKHFELNTRHQLVDNPIETSAKGDVVTARLTIKGGS